MLTFEMKLSKCLICLDTSQPICLRASAIPRSVCRFKHFRYICLCAVFRILNGFYTCMTEKVFVNIDSSFSLGWLISVFALNGGPGN